MDIRPHVDAIAQHMAAILAVFRVPTSALFDANHEEIVRLEEVLNLKSAIDNATTYSADLAGAGQLVGSRRTVDFFIEKMGLSRRDALQRMRNAQLAFSMADPHSGNGREDDDHPPTLSSEKRTIITQELGRLCDKAAAEKERIYHESIHEAAERSPEDLRHWMRTRIRKANAHYPTDTDPFADIRKRRLTIQRPDADGGAYFSGYLPRAELAVMESLLAPSKRPGHLLDTAAQKDKRSLTQRRFDAFAQMIRQHSWTHTQRSGLASVVLSLTSEDVDDVTDATSLIHHRYATNTGVELSPLDVLRLGSAKYHYVVVHDADTGDPLHVGRAERLATPFQRIALLARDFCCTHPGCDQPATQCDAHHMESWFSGGPTDIENLTLLCRCHHMSNNDARNGAGNWGYADRDPDTGTIGYRPPPTHENPHPGLQVNTTVRASQSAKNRIRRRKRMTPSTRLRC